MGSGVGVVVAVIVGSSVNDAGVILGAVVLMVLKCWSWLQWW